MANLGARTGLFLEIYSCSVINLNLNRWDAAAGVGCINEKAHTKVI